MLDTNGRMNQHPATGMTCVGPYDPTRVCEGGVDGAPFFVPFSEPQNLRQLQLDHEQEHWEIATEWARARADMPNPIGDPIACG